jgi:hypothetical protein
MGEPANPHLANVWKERFPECSWSAKEEGPHRLGPDVGCRHFDPLYSIYCASYRATVQCYQVGVRSPEYGGLILNRN